MTIAIAIHGGAGILRRADMTLQRDRLTREGLSAALEAGHTVLLSGGSAVDAVVASVLALENNPLFNAGKGAVFTFDGTVELEAALMDGSTQQAGTVTGVTVAKNPILVAKQVMEFTPNVMLGFAAADAFAKEQGLECVRPEYYFTETRWNALQLEKERLSEGGSDKDIPEDRKHGTIGAVALDDQGRLAAATSTGGRTAKWVGRIGDTPIIGAGTWADANCAISCTGHGEYFIRTAAAHDVAARMAYGGQTLQEACEEVIQKSLVRIGGTGGLIGVDSQGNVAMPVNCEGMYRGMVDGKGDRLIAIYGDE